MATFTIYPKEGEPFCFECARFEFDGTNFVFFASRTPGSRPYDQSYLATTQIAAVVPTRIAASRYSDSIRFRVYLRGRTHVIEVLAHEFDRSGETIEFFWLTMTRDGLQREAIEQVYIASSEVVAILPADGL